MIHLRAILLITALLSFFVVGCSPAEEVTDEKPSVTFQGKTDSRLFGTWKREGVDSTYVFNEDGTYKLTGKVKTQGGTFDNNVAGYWLVNGDQVLFKDQSGNVVPYAVEWKGQQVTLSLTGSLKNKTVLNKK